MSSKQRRKMYGIRRERRRPRGWTRWFNEGMIEAEDCRRRAARTSSGGRIAAEIVAETSSIS